MKDLHQKRTIIYVLKNINLASMWRRGLAEQGKKQGGNDCNNLEKDGGRLDKGDRHVVMKSGQILNILRQDC